MDPHPDTVAAFPNRATVYTRVGQQLRGRVVGWDGGVNADVVKVKLEGERYLRGYPHSRPDAEEPTGEDAHDQLTVILPEE